MQWKELIEDAALEFTARNIPDPDLSAEFLAAHVMKVWKRSEVRALETTTVTEDQQYKYQQLIERRILHEPIQYIVGETEFYGMRLFCTPAALIPRPDTEVVVEEALRVLWHKAAKDEVLRVLDIGTGTGAIALAIAKQLPMTECVGIDISGGAVALAKKNAAHLAITNARFSELDIFRELPDSLGKFDLIVSNPPYISTEELNRLHPQVIHFEPRNALTDEASGFSFYKRIAEIAPHLLRSDGTIVVELGFTSRPEVDQIFQRAGYSASFVKDLAQIDRVLIAEHPAAQSA